MKPILALLSCAIGFSGILSAGQSPLSVVVAETPHNDGVHGDQKTVSFKIANLSASVVSAVIIKSDCVNSSDPSKFNRITKRDDTLIRFLGDDVLIPPGGTKVYEIGGAPDLVEWKCSGELQGAFFEGGASIGDPAVLARIRQIRAAVAREVDWHIAALTDAHDRHDRRDVLLDAIDKHNQSAMDSAQSRDERLAIHDVSHVIDDNLRRMHLASGLPQSDEERIEIILAHLKEWQQRLARQLAGDR